MNFFCTKEHLDEYQILKELGNESVFCLDAREALKAARALFSL